MTVNFKFRLTYSVDQNLEALVYVNGKLDEYYDPLTEIFIQDDEHTDQLLMIRNDSNYTYVYNLDDKISVLIREHDKNLYGWGTLNGTEKIAFKNF